MKKEAERKKKLAYNDTSPVNFTKKFKCTLVLIVTLTFFQLEQSVNEFVYDALFNYYSSPD